eukprot:957775-Pyramimonas_sp.AAC.1
MDYFFVTNSWGVSTAWLRQFTERSARQHVSFQTEAVAHEREAARVGDLDSAEQSGLEVRESLGRMARSRSSMPAQ